MSDETYSVALTETEIEALDDLSYYGGDHLLCTWSSEESGPLMEAVWSAIEKMRKALPSD